MNLKAGDYLINGLLVYSEGDTPIVLITQRGAAKRMLAQEITQLGRAKRGLMVLRELKKNPHRVVYMGSGENQQLLVTNQKGQAFEVITNQIPINDRTSNGSFIMDEKTGGQIYEVKTNQSCNRGGFCTINYNKTAILYQYRMAVFYLLINLSHLLKTYFNKRFTFKIYL